MKTQLTYFCFSDAWGTDPLFSGHGSCQCLCCCHQHLGCCRVTKMPHRQSHLMSGHHDPWPWTGSLLPLIYTALRSQNCNEMLCHTLTWWLTAKFLGVITSSKYRNVLWSHKGKSDYSPSKSNITSAWKAPLKAGYSDTIFHVFPLYFQFILG